MSGYQLVVLLEGHVCGFLQQVLMIMKVVSKEHFVKDSKPSSGVKFIVLSSPNKCLGTRASRGLLLIELFVGSQFIAILAAILFLFRQAREKARQTSCLSKTGCNRKSDVRARLCG